MIGARVSQSSAPRRAAHAAVLVTLALLAACGKKGPPLAPLRVAPARIEDLTVVRTGDTVRARFTVPAINENKSTPVDIVAVELLALSGKPQDALGQPMGGAEFVRLADVAGRLDVKPILTDAPPEVEAAAKLDPRPAPGEIGVITETLTPDARIPFVHPRKRPASAQDEEEPPTEVRPLTGPPPDEPLSRVYVVTSLSRKGVRAGVSNRVTVPIGEQAVSPPVGVTAAYNETLAIVTWQPPADAALPTQRAPLPTELAARPLTTARVPTTYNVYEVVLKDGVPSGTPTLINPAPTAILGVATPIGPFGVERCFVVHAGLQYGTARIEGPASAVSCAKLVDVFPPAAPKGLVAVGSEGGVSLIWDANTEADLVGYIVMRGEIGAGGAAPTALAPLMTEPVKETTWRDNTARPGVRYVYAVVAVDNASPRNTSAESNRVEEGVR